jgi:hypothetical protein
VQGGKSEEARVEGVKRLTPATSLGAHHTQKPHSTPHQNYKVQSKASQCTLRLSP